MNGNNDLMCNLSSVYLGDGNAPRLSGWDEGKVSVAQTPHQVDRQQKAANIRGKNTTECASTPRLTAWSWSVSDSTTLMSHLKAKAKRFSKRLCRYL